MSVKKEDRLYIIIPAYNEEDNIKNVIEEWYPVVERYHGDGTSRLVIIDDGSRDKTFEIIKSMAESRPLLCPITKSNEGHGATVLYGYHYALNHHADYVFQTDSDGQTLPEEFHQFWALRDKYAMVIGYRNKRQDGFSRVVVTKTLKLVILICFHVSVTDANTPFRLMNAAELKENIQWVPEQFNLSNVLLSVIYAKRRQPVKYLPITFRPRQGGKNSINLPKIMKIGKTALQDFIRINKVLEQKMRG